MTATTGALSGCGQAQVDGEAQPCRHGQGRRCRHRCAGGQEVVVLNQRFETVHQSAGFEMVDQSLTRQDRPQFARQLLERSMVRQVQFQTRAALDGTQTRRPHRHGTRTAAPSRSPPFQGDAPPRPHDACPPEQPAKAPPRIPPGTGHDGSPQVISDGQAPRTAGPTGNDASGGSSRCGTVSRTVRPLERRPSRSAIHCSAVCAVQPASASELAGGRCSSTLSPPTRAGERSD